VVCWLYSGAKELQCKYNAQDNVNCDFFKQFSMYSESGATYSRDVYAPSVGWGCHTLLSQEVVSLNIVKNMKKWFTVF